MNAPASALAAHEMSRPASSALTQSTGMEYHDARLASGSIEKIDGLIIELQEMQGVLKSEAERVQREVGNYAQMLQTALAATKTITDSFAALGTRSSAAGRGQTFTAGQRSGGRERLKRWPAPAG